MGDTPSKSHGYDVAMGFVYAVVIGLNVYLIVNELSDGALSTSLAMRLAYWRQKASVWRERQATAKRETGRVIWEATNIVEGNEND